MNCQDFEQIVGDLARRRPLDASERAEALAHERGCEHCAARLSDERALSAGLRALAATMKEREAPARAEASLLAAFRARAAEAGHAPKPAPEAAPEAAPVEALPAGVLPFTAKPRADKLWSWKKTLATAATAAAAAAVTLAVLIPRGTATRTTNAPTIASVAPPVASESPAVATRDSNQLDPRERFTHDASGDAPTANDVVPQRAFSTRSAPRAQVMNASMSSTPRRQQATRADAAEPEITTEFMALSQGGGLASGESGHVIRVELPRTALASFGLPMNVETTGGRVKADVLLGEDGTARAIRFVK